MLLCFTTTSSIIVFYSLCFPSACYNRDLCIRRTGITISLVFPFSLLCLATSPLSASQTCSVTFYTLPLSLCLRILHFLHPRSPHAPESPPRLHSSLSANGGILWQPTISSEHLKICGCPCVRVCVCVCEFARVCMS